MPNEKLIGKPTLKFGWSQTRGLKFKFKSP